MSIDYDIVLQVHGIDAVYSDHETHRRLREVREDSRPSARIKSMQRTLGRKSDHLNQTECDTLRNWPAEGVNLGYWSKALVYAPKLVHRPQKEANAIVSLVRLGYLGIVEGNTADGNRKQVLVRI